MGLRTRYDALLARHLRHPEGFLGRFVAGRLDRRNRLLIEAGIDALDLRPASVVADIGFGAGIGLQLLLERDAVEQVIGVDFSTAMVEGARKRFAEELRQGCLRLELREVARVLRPEGRLVIGIGDPDAMARMPFTAHGFNLRSIDELQATIAASGLTLIDHRRPASASVPGHLLVVGP